MPTPRQRALPLGLETSDVPHRLKVITSHHVSSPNCLESCDAVANFLVLLIRLVSHVPAFEQLEISRRLRLHLPHVPHPFTLLDDFGRLQLLLDAFPRNRAANVLL